MSYAMNNIEEAIKQAKSQAKKRKFTETMEISVGLKEIDLKNPANRINLETSLPKDLGKKVKIALFAEGELSTKGNDLGLTVISKDEIESIGKDKNAAKKIVQDHDFFISEPRFMPLVGRFLGKILGPRGKMPKPVPPRTDLEELITRYNKMVKLRVKSNPVINTKFGKADQDDKDLAENASVIIQELTGKLEKGTNQIKSISIKTTMGPTVKVLKT